MSVGAGVGAGVATHERRSRTSKQASFTPNNNFVERGREEK